MLQPISNGSDGHPKRPGQFEFVVAHPAAAPARDNSMDARDAKGYAGNDDDCAVWLHERLTACYND